MHEVLPTTVDRLALTTWFYGGPTPSDVPTTAATIPKSLGKPNTATFETIEASPATLNRSHTPDASLPPPGLCGGGMALPPPAIPDLISTIFVSIPSYCDSECQPTVAHLFATATAPSRVFAGLCLQHDEGDPAQAIAFAAAYGDQVRVKRMHPADATGPCLARWETQQLWRGEPYYLQIDSHMRFRQGWDVFLIHELSQCSSPRAILTTYPLGYNLPNQITRDIRPTLLCASHFDSNGLVRQCSKVLKTSPSKPIPSMFWAAGFAFSRATVLQEVMYDPSLTHLFFGEENVMAARLWTHGYDFFAPTEAVVYHLWSRSHRPTFRDHQRNGTEAQQRSIQRVLKMLKEGDEGPCGLGRVRTIEAFVAAQGVHYSTKEIAWASLWSNRDPIEFDLAATPES
ncbi:hypothetical protein, variant [Aphanomyces invadans]|nr:hypothetical protein, variant [Aphanomyces invadans]ETW10480.1 hypothetical protein, variant [Aphanomyces invadans]|eukprot:XP_008861891.1 hypothetical protein, variant [Aphanomyces invadans]